jgi:hypothetical protein
VCSQADLGSNPDLLDHDYMIVTQPRVGPLKPVSFQVERGQQCLPAGAAPKKPVELLHGVRAHLGGDVSKCNSGSAT